MNFFLRLENGKWLNLAQATCIEDKGSHIRVIFNDPERPVKVTGHTEAQLIRVYLEQTEFKFPARQYRGVEEAIDESERINLSPKPD
jgi:hypothetical protein